jgi:hypothetical protein
MKNKYGFVDKEVWDLDDTITKFLIPRLKRFKEVNNSFPPKLTWKRWNKILNEIIKDLEFSTLDNNYDGKKYINFQNKQIEKRKEAMHLIAEYMEWLWW